MSDFIIIIIDRGKFSSDQERKKEKKGRKGEYEIKKIEYNR